jgi:hypothetical protein
VGGHVVVAAVVQDYWSNVQEEQCGPDGPKRGVLDAD